MHSKFKKLATFLTAACMSFTTIAFTACNPEEPEDTPPPPPEQNIPEPDNGNPATDGYNITVQYPDGSVVKGSDSGDRYAKVSVELTDENGTIVNSSATADLNEAGVAQINYNVPGEYYIKINDIPPGYDFDSKSVKTSADVAYYTVSLELGAPTPYTVTLIDPDGNPLENVNVKLMDGEKEVATATSNANGVATTPAIVRGAYDVVIAMPDGLGYKPAKTSIGLTSVKAEIVKLLNLPFDNEHLLDEEGINYWDDALNFYYPSKEAVKANPTEAGNMINLKFDPETDCYAYNLNVGEGEEIFYTITATKTGAYTIGSKKSATSTKANYKIQFYANDLSYCDDSLTISSATNNGNNVQHIRIEKGEKLTFSVKSYDGNASTVELLISVPEPEPETTVATAPGTYTLNFTDGVKEAIVRFKTSEIGSGIFELSAETNYNISVQEVSQTNIILEKDLKLPYTREITNSEVGGYTDYHIYINDDIDTVAQPAQIQFKITRTGDAHLEIYINETAEAHVTEKFDNQTGEFKWVTFDGNAEIVEENGLYYVMVNSVKKPLVVAISKNLPVFNPDEAEDLTESTDSVSYSFTTMEYYGEAGYTPGEKQNTKLTITVKVTDDTTITTTKTDYSAFIDTYASYANDDGVYQVNKELQAFLKLFMDQMYGDFTGSTTSPEVPWLIACGYYA